MTTTNRRCPHCSDPLPEGSDARRQYCTDACRVAAYRRRQRTLPERTEDARLRAQLASVAGKLVDAEKELRQSRARENVSARELADLRRELAAERRSSTREIASQASKNASFRGQLATAVGELSMMRRNWSAAAEAKVSTDEVAGLRQRVVTLQDRHTRLLARYNELVSAAELAATERQQLQGVVRQWDTLCKRLYSATGGQPPTSKDRHILETWRRFRKAAAEPVIGRGRTPASGGTTTGDM